MTINFDPSKDYYSVLGLDKAADVEVIKTVFRVLAKRYLYVVRTFGTDGGVI